MKRKLIGTVGDLSEYVGTWRYIIGKVTKLYFGMGIDRSKLKVHSLLKSR